MAMILKFVVICGVALFFWAQAPAAAQTNGQGAGIDFDDTSHQGLGSLEQYNRDGWDSEDVDFRVPLIGIVVRNGQGKLENGQQLRGLGVTEVQGGSPAGASGVRGERAALRAALVGTFFAGSLIFPPALFGVALVEGSGLGQPRDLIIAVDSVRTRDVMEFESAIRRAEIGETVYLTIVRDGRRQQLRVNLAGDRSGASNVP